MKLTVKDLAITHRVVEVPATCPRCKRDLREDGAVTVTEYMMVWYEGSTLTSNDGKFEYGDNGYEWDGSGNLENIAFSCTCGEQLAVGREHVAFKLPTEDEQRIADAEMYLRLARELLKQAKCPKTLNRVRLALTSVQGAARSASHRKYRDERKAQRQAAREAK